MAWAGQSGALFGTLFLKGSAGIRGRKALSKRDLEGMWRAGLHGVKARGKADIGDKTMVDAWRRRLRHSRRRDDWTAAWKAAAAAADKGAQSTAAMVARQGRAKYLGERGIGHVDPGATTIALMFQAFCDDWMAGRDK